MFFLNFSKLLTAGSGLFTNTRYDSFTNKVFIREKCHCVGVIRDIVGRWSTESCYDFREYGFLFYTSSREKGMKEISEIPRFSFHHYKNISFHRSYQLWKWV